MTTQPDVAQASDIAQRVRQLVQLSAAAVPRLELQTILLGRAQAEIVNFGIEPPFEVSTTTSGQWGRSEDGEAFHAHVDVALEATAASDPGTVVWQVAVSYWLFYSVSPGPQLEHEQLDAYAATGAIFSAWPYVREIVQDLTNRMGVPPLTLPLLKTPLDVALFTANDTATA